MSNLVDFAQLHIEDLGYYSDVTYVERSDDYLYFQAKDDEGDVVDLKVEIDDEIPLDEWNVYESYDAFYWTPVD